MGRFRVYIKPRDDEGNFTDFIEVTEDVDFNSTGLIKQQIDNNEFNVGEFKFSDFPLKLRNQDGMYSDVDVVQSIFRTRRAGSIFKMEWEPAAERPVCGLAVAGSSYGATISEPKDVFVGVLNDESAKLDIDDQQISFRALSTDSIFPATEADFSLLSNGQLYSEALLAILSQDAIIEYLTIDVANITVGLDQTFDDVSEFENKTVKEVMDEILFQSNSVLFIKNETVYVRARDGGATSQYTFIGQGSNNGVEDIIKISDIASGLNKVFNFWTFRDTTLVAKDDDSVRDNLVRKKEIDVAQITDTAKRQAIIDAQRTEFSLKKQSFELTVSITPDLLDLFLLDQVRVDYPTTFIPSESGGELPIYGVAIYGESEYGFGEFSLTVDKDTPYKIMGRNIDTKKQQLRFKLQEM